LNRCYGWATIIPLSTQEILEELPKLTPAELKSICRRAIELSQGLALEASPELLAAIDEADESFAKDGGIEISEVSILAAGWAGKFEMPAADSSDPRLKGLLERYR
jgi:hypothetical protein